MYLNEKLPAVESPDTIGARLLKAAQIIRERGWSQHNYEDRHGRVCAVGAIMLAVDGQTYGTMFCASHKALDTINHFQRHVSPHSVQRFNDKIARSADEVIAALEKAAYS